MERSKVLKGGEVRLEIGVQISPIEVSYDSRSTELIMHLSTLIQFVELYKSSRLTYFPFR